MAFVVFLRGINVGGHRRFRPSRLAEELAAYDIVNIGAAGTLVVRGSVARARFLAELRQRLQFNAEIAICEGRDLLRLERENPFGAEPSRPGMVQFVSILAKPARSKPQLPLHIPDDAEWFVRIVGSRQRLVFGIYRRHMKTIGSLGHIDRIFGSPAITRSWSTVLTVLAILKNGAAR